MAMRFSRPYILASLLPAVVVSLLACTKEQPGTKEFSYKNFTVAKGSAEAGEGHAVTFKGDPKPLAGPGVKVGDQLRDVQVVKGDLSLVNITDTRGTVRVISLVPSIDTAVCEQQTHHLSEKSGGLDKSVTLMTVSVDTPFAQSRFAQEAKIANVTFLSDYRGGEFGKAHGLLVKNPHILARAVMVVDKDNVIRYLQVTPELAQMPDMDAAFNAARELAAKG
jgi:thiol peroxidase